MLLVHTAVTNITILSIFEIFLSEFDYRTVNVFTTNSSKAKNSGVLEMVINTLNKRERPTNILNFNTNVTNRERCEEPILNIIFLMNTTTAFLDGIKYNIYPHDVSLILDDSVIQNSNTKIGMNIDDMQVSNKVILIKNLSMLALHPMRHKMDIMPLRPFERRNAKYFIQSYLHSSMYLKQEKNLTIFFQYMSPRSMVAFIKKSCFYIGSDGSITAILLKLLNATGTFVSDIAILYPRILNSAVRSTLNVENRQKKYRNAMTRNNVTVFNKSIAASDITLHMSPYTVQPYFDDKNLNFSTEHLYPHERECVVAIVPKQKKPDNFLTKVARNGDVQSIGLAMFTLIIARIMIEKAPYRKWFAIGYKTFGILINQAVIRNDNFLESAWTNIVKGFSAITTIALSAIIYDNLVNDKYSEIDTIDDLIASNLTAIAPDSLKSQLTLRLLEKRPKLLKNIVFKNFETLGASILALNFSFAYIVKENLAHNYLNLLKYKKGDSGRIMMENLYCDLLSYRINLKSHYKNFVEDFVLRVFENGLYRKHLEWATALWNGFLVKPPPDTLAIESFKSTFTIKMISGVFNLYLIGIGISFTVFLIENIYVKYTRRLLKF